MSGPQISAILVNYNAGDELRRALQSLYDEMYDMRWEAAVVDNASTDGSQTIVAEFRSHARLHANQANVGFARGVNQGLRATTAPLVLIMNPDSRLVAGAIAALLAGRSEPPPPAPEPASGVGILLFMAGPL